MTRATICLMVGLLSVLGGCAQPYTVRFCAPLLTRGGRPPSANRDRYRPEICEQTVLAAINLTRPDLGEQIQELIGLWDKLRSDCAGTLARDPTQYRRVLVHFRETVAAWYQKDQIGHWAILTGDQGMMIGGRRPGTVDWSSYYLLSEQELRRLRLDGLERDLGFRELPHALIRTDALTGGLRSARWGTARERQQSQWLACSYQEALVTEGKLWATGNETATLGERVRQVTQGVVHIPEQWGPGRNEEVRFVLGLPYAKYLDAVQKLVSEVAWGIPLPSRTTVEDLKGKVAFDQFNVRALFKMYEAQAAWIKVLGGKAAATDSSDARRSLEDLAPAAAMELQSAFDLTDDRWERVRLVSQILRSVMSYLRTNRGQVGESRGADAAAKVEQILLGRKLAEYALCLMNRAYLHLPGAPACSFPMPLQATQGQRPCALADASIRFDEVRAVLPAKQGYELVLATIDVNTPLAADSRAPRGKDRLSASVGCELAAIQGASRFSDLHMELDSYEHALSVMERETLPMQEPQFQRQAAGLLHQAVIEADRRMKASAGEICPECRAREMRASIDRKKQNLKPATSPGEQTPPKPSEKESAAHQALAREVERNEQYLALYCRDVETAANIYEGATQSDSYPTSLLVRIRPELKGGRWDEVKELGERFASEFAVCQEIGYGKSQASEKPAADKPPEQGTPPPPTPPAQADSRPEDRGQVSASPQDQPPPQEAQERLQNEKLPAGKVGKLWDGAYGRDLGYGMYLLVDGKSQSAKPMSLTKQQANDFWKSLQGQPKHRIPKSTDLIRVAAGLRKLARNLKLKHLPHVVCSDMEGTTTQGASLSGYQERSKDKVECMPIQDNGSFWLVVATSRR